MKDNTDKTDIFREFPEILKEELTPAFGCTEPIAIAYCASKLRDVLGCAPESILVEASGNIIKNVKSVIVPNTGGLKGIAAAAAAGIAAGRTERKLEVIAEVSQEEKQKIRECLERIGIEIRALEDGDKLDIRMTGEGNGHTAFVRVAKYHSNIVRIEKDGAVLLEAAEENAPVSEKKADRSGLCIENIVAFAERAELSTVKETLERQIKYNYAIAQEGLEHEWGANIGNVLLKSRGSDVRTGGSRFRCAHERLRASGSDQLGQRESGHHGFGPCYRICETSGCFSGIALQSASCVEPYRHSFEIRNWSALSLLRGSERRLRGGLWYRVAVRRRAGGGFPYACQCNSDSLGNRLRRGKAVLCRKDSSIGGCRDTGL